ncbi:MAG: histidine kinase [Vicingaceae bacterium]|nr:histidine kinase [Vicingaceae bacterium]
MFAQEQYQQKSSYSKIRSKSADSRVAEVQSKLNDAQKLFKKNPEKALDLVHDGLLIAIKENYLNEEAEAYGILGQFNFDLNEYSLSLKNYNKAIAIYTNLTNSSARKKSKSPSNFQRKLNQLFHPAGKAAELSNDLILGATYYRQYLNNVTSDNDIVKARTALGDISLKSNDLNTAETAYKTALKIEQKRDNKNGITILNLKLGELEKVKKNAPKAIEYFRNSQNTAIQINNDKLANQAFTNISRIHQEEKNIEEGIQINQEALNFNQERNNQSEASKNNIDIANFLLQQDKNEEAIGHLQNSVTIAEKTGDIVNQSKAFKALSEAYDKTGQESEAIKKYKEYQLLEDSLYNLRKTQLATQNKKGAMLENAQNKLSLLEKDKQLNEKTIEILQQERIIQEEFITQQRILTYSLLFGILILLITAFLVYRSNKAKNKANKLLILKSLRAQMNPHFIFNSLNSVNSFISKNDERAANRYLSDFSRLMRDVMENSQEDFIPLSKEIDILEVYLKLENHRFKDKFDYSFTVDKSINTEDSLIPPMLIQPYIENAVWHGLRYKEEKGFLKVDISQKGNDIVITIEDDGIGRKKSQEIKTENQKSQQSTGIKNIDSRLKIIEDIFKTKLDVTIEDTNKVQESGTIVTVKVYQENLTTNE